MQKIQKEWKPRRKRRRRKCHQPALPPTSWPGGKGPLIGGVKRDEKGVFVRLNAYTRIRWYVGTLVRQSEAIGGSGWLWWRLVDVLVSSLAGLGRKTATAIARFSGSNNLPRFLEVSALSLPFFASLRRLPPTSERSLPGRPDDRTQSWTRRLLRLYPQQTSHSTTGEAPPARLGTTPKESTPARCSQTCIYRTHFPPSHQIPPPTEVAKARSHACLTTRS